MPPSLLPALNDSMRRPLGPGVLLSTRREHTRAPSLLVCINQPAAAGWLMHTSNDGARVCSRLVESTTPGPNGRRMLAFRAGGNEGGIYQDVRGIVDPARAYMFSAWVFVRSGKVGMSGTNSVGGPASFTTKVGEWEQLRVCTNSLAVTDILSIYNQDAAGGTFFVDRVELREIPIVE